MEGGERRELLDLRHHVVVNHHGLAVLTAPLDHPVADRDDPRLVEIGADLVAGGDDHGERRRVVGDRVVGGDGLIAVGVLERAGGFADALHQTVGEGLARVGIDELILQRG